MKYILLLLVLFSCQPPVTDESQERRKPAPTPAPCGRQLPDPILTSVTIPFIDSTRMSLTFDALQNVNNYVLFVQNPTGTRIIDNVKYRQATAGYRTLPMWINFGYAPLYINGTYTCRVGIYYNGGCYSYSQPFTISTNL